MGLARCSPSSRCGDIPARRDLLSTGIDPIVERRERQRWHRRRVWKSLTQSGLARWRCSQARKRQDGEGGHSRGRDVWAPRSAGGSDGTGFPRTRRYRFHGEGDSLPKALREERARSARLRCKSRQVNGDLLHHVTWSKWQTELEHHSRRARQDDQGPCRSWCRTVTTGGARLSHCLRR